ncbi:MAG: hypothetical protein WC800_08020 [Candidatus Nanopelagicaceae bacterium]|jgi:hypothetical protein
MGDQWSDAIRASDEAYKEMIAVMNIGHVTPFIEAEHKYKLAEMEEERAAIRAGHFPAWPPLTDEGLEKIGLTRQQVDKILADNAERDRSKGQYSD